MLILNNKNFDEFDVSIATIQTLFSHCSANVRNGNGNSFSKEISLLEFRVLRLPTTMKLHEECLEEQGTMRHSHCGQHLD